MDLIYGRSGVGKTEYILNKIIRNQKNGEKTILMTPEQFSFAMEKRLLNVNNNQTCFNMEVLSFERLAHRILSELGLEAKNIITSAGKAMIINTIIEKEKKNLDFLSNSTDNIELVLKQISEFKKNNVSVESLENRLANIKDEYLKRKLSDLLLIYRNYEEQIINFTDENDILEILYENMDKSDFLNNVNIYIDEFAGFTKQEYKIIEKMNELAKTITISLCIDDTIVAKSPDVDVFYDNKQTLNKLKKIFSNINEIKIENTTNKNEEMEFIEQNLFSFPSKIYKNNVNNISLYVCKNQYSEIEQIAKIIRNLVIENEYRYRDIGIIIKNIEVYSNLVKAIFTQYDIPYFIDEKIDIKNSQIVKFVVSVLDIFTKNWSYEAMFNFIKSGYIKLNNINKLENYCLKWNIKGKKWYEKAWNYDIKNYNEEQNLIVEPLLNLQNEIQKDNSTINITRAFYNFIKKFDLVTEYDKKCFNSIIDLLNEVGEIFKNKKMNMNEYLRIIKIGLEQKELGKIPETQDAVVIGNVDRTKSNKMKAIFIIGINEGIIPGNGTDEGFLNDSDREEMKSFGLEISKGIVEKSYEENFNIYKAFSTSNEKLILTYPKSDYSGNSLRNSLLVTKILKIFPKLEEKKEEDFEFVYNKVTAFKELIKNIEKEENLELLRWFYNNDREKVDFILKGIEFTNIAENLTEENVNKLYKNKLYTTVTRLEKYSECPFAYHLKYGLKLREKEEFNVRTLDTGTFMHNIIDIFFDENKNVKKFEDEEIETIVSKIIDEQLNFSPKIKLSIKQNILINRLKKIVVKSIKYIVDGLRKSDFEVFGTEINFGGENTGKLSFPPINIELNDKKIEIIGKIDRVDIAKINDKKYVRIIDYKSSVKDIDLNKVVNGLQIQLLTYIDALCDNEQMEIDLFPAGVLYYNLIESAKLGEKNPDINMIENEIRKNYRMKGIVVGDINIIKAMDKEFESKSEIIPVSLSKSGEVMESRSSTLNKEEFEKLQKQVKNTIKKIANSIFKGNIDIRPSYYKGSQNSTPCTYCEYKSICQFNPKLKNNKYKIIEKKKKEELLERISQIKLDNI